MWLANPSVTAIGLLAGTFYATMAARVYLDSIPLSHVLPQSKM